MVLIGSSTLSVIWIQACYQVSLIAGILNSAMIVKSDYGFNESNSSFSVPN